MSLTKYQCLDCSTDIARGSLRCFDCHIISRFGKKKRNPKKTFLAREKKIDEATLKFQNKIDDRSCESVLLEIKEKQLEAKRMIMDMLGEKYAKREDIFRKILNVYKVIK